MKKLIAAAVLAASFTAPAHAVVVVSGNGTLQAGDPSTPYRLFRDSVASTWASQKAFPGTTGAGGFVYDLINVAFAANAFQDIFYRITVTNLDTLVNSNPAAYLNSFNPANLATNYLGDGGGTPGAGQSVVFDVKATAGNSLVLHIGSVSSGALPSDYSYKVEAFSDARLGENFVTNAVPEPTTWALMLAGFGFVGAAMRRKAAVRNTTVRYA